METKSRGVLDPPVKPGDDIGGWNITTSVIARSEATKQSILSLRLHGLLRFARNDGVGIQLSLQAGRDEKQALLLEN
jgi:hypothetical protein